MMARRMYILVIIKKEVTMTKNFKKKKKKGKNKKNRKNLKRNFSFGLPGLQIISGKHKGA